MVVVECQEALLIAKKVPSMRLVGASGGFFTRNAQPLASLPEVFTANTELLCQLGFAHLILVFKHKVLKVIFQRKIVFTFFGVFIHAATGSRRAGS